MVIKLPIHIAILLIHIHFFEIEEFKNKILMVESKQNLWLNIFKINKIK